MVVEYTFGKMEGSTMDNGKIMIWKDLGYICGVMEEGMKDNTKMIRIKKYSVCHLHAKEIRIPSFYSPKINLIG